MTPDAAPARPLTGRKVLAIFVALFGTIIAVNLTLAFNAVATFPGLETRNSYVASQQFDARRAAQQALGWTTDLSLDGGMLVLDLRDRDGAPLGDVQIGGVLGRATLAAEDRLPEWRFDGTHWRAPADLAPGNWDLRLELSRGDDTFRRRLKLEVRP